MAKGKKGNSLYYIFWIGVVVLVILFIYFMVWEFKDQRPPAPIITKGEGCEPLLNATYCIDYTFNWCVKFPGKRGLGNFTPTFLYFEGDRKVGIWNKGEYERNNINQKNGKIIVYFSKKILNFKPSNPKITLQMITSKGKSKKSKALTVEKKCSTLSSTPVFVYDSKNPDKSAYYFCPDNPYPTLMWKCDFSNEPKCESENAKFKLTFLGSEIPRSYSGYFSPNKNGIYSYTIGTNINLSPGNYNVNLISICGPSNEEKISLPAETKLLKYPDGKNDMVFIDNETTISPRNPSHVYLKKQNVTIKWEIYRSQDNDYYIERGTCFLIYKYTHMEDDILVVNFNEDSGNIFSAKYDLPSETGPCNIFVSIWDNCMEIFQSSLVYDVIIE